MDEVSLLQTFGQVSSSETGQIFREFLRGHVREMVCEVMAAEVTQVCGVCGPKHSRGGGDHYRSGSGPARVLYEGERDAVMRPRVDSARRWSSPASIQLPLRRASVELASRGGQDSCHVAKGLSETRWSDISAAPFGS